MKYLRLFSVLSLAVLVFLMPFLFWSCSDGTVDSNQSILNESTVLEIFYELASVMDIIGFGWHEQTFNEKNDEYFFSYLYGFFSTQIEISEDFSCDSGGIIEVTGILNYEINQDGSGTSNFEFWQIPVNCAINTSQGTLVINGNPDIHIEGNLVFLGVDALTQFNYDLNGSFNWSGIGSSGSCNISMSYRFDWNNPESISITGNMCGYRI